MKSGDCDTQVAPLELALAWKRLALEREQRERAIRGYVDMMWRGEIFEAVFRIPFVRVWLDGGRTSTGGSSLALLYLARLDGAYRIAVDGKGAVSRLLDRIDEQAEEHVQAVLAWSRQAR